VPTVPFTIDKHNAEDWARGGAVYVRHTLTGHSGEGIEIIKNPTFGSIQRLLNELNELRFYDIATLLSSRVNERGLPLAPLYTKGINNGGEYRVHVFNGEIIDYRKKSRQYDNEATTDQREIRTLENGWVYRTSNLRRLERVENLALSAIDALGLDFGAVDIIMDENRSVHVLEVNTAVGMDDVTLGNYVEKITTYYAT